jgi:hypothetical protein
MSYQHIQKTSLLFFVILILLSVTNGCGQITPTGLPALIQTAYVTTTPSPIPTATNTMQVAITANPDQLARWREYERALASKFLSYLPPEEVICEWEILGQSEQEVYVWAVCLGLPPAGRSEKYAPIASIPSAIHLGSDGSVQSVELPRDDGNPSYSEGIRKIFPIDVQERIFNNLINYGALTDHAKLRRKNPGPPLIVLSATPQP